MEQASELFNHVFVNNNAERTLFLLHGTGGTKEDFLFLDHELQNRYNLVGLQGNVDEDGMARFFKRHRAGVFDEDSIRREAEKLRQFILSWTETHKIDIQKLFFLGYSNGANMLLSTVFLYPETMQNLIVLHPVLPAKIQPNEKLPAQRIFVTTGVYDSMIPYTDQLELINVLKSATGTNLIVKEYQSGHEITPAELHDVISHLLY